MTETNKTLYIPLYGKAVVSELGIILDDKKAEEIWKKEGFTLKGKAKSKWLCYYMSMRARVFDIALERAIEKLPQAYILHIGCGMDSRCLRVSCENQWYDMDFDSVITQRRKYFAENGRYRMISADATKPEAWLANFEKDSNAIVVMEGVSMYLSRKDMENLLLQLQKHFENVIFIADFYTQFGAKASKYKNPVKEVGADIVSGMDNPDELVLNSGIKYTRQWDMTPPSLVKQLPAKDQPFFSKLMAGSFAKKLYRMYEYTITSK